MTDIKELDDDCACGGGAISGHATGCPEAAQFDSPPSPAPAESRAVAWKVARMEMLDRAKTIDGGDFAGCLEPPNDLATTIAIIAAGYEFTLDVDGRLAALVAGDMGYASTDIVLEPLVMEAIGPSLRAASPAPSASMGRVTDACWLSHFTAQNCNHAALDSAVGVLRTGLASGSYQSALWPAIVDYVERAHLAALRSQP